MIFTIIFILRRKKSKKSKQKNEIELQNQNSNENNNQQQTTQYKSIQKALTNQQQYEIFNSNQRTENQTSSSDSPSQYQQIPNFSDKSSLNSNQYFGMSTVNNQLDFKIPKAIEIDISQLKFEKKLGEGNFGVVFQAKFNSKTRLGQNKNNQINQNEEIVACKLLKSKYSIGLENGKNEEISIDNKKLKEFVEEAQIMSKIPNNNNHVIKLIGICAQPFCIVSEYIDGGNLKQYLSSKEVSITIGQAIEFMKQICEGLQHLHQNKIIHR